MTSATSRSNVVRRGFSLVELLVVIGIILILAGIALPMLVKAYSQAEKTKRAGDLAAIATALNAFRDDHGQYPQVPAADGGATALYNSIAKPYKPRSGGKSYGPYIRLDRFKVDTTNEKLLDRDGNPIVYFVRLNAQADKSKGVPSAANGYYASNGTGAMSGAPMWDITQNLTQFGGGTTGANRIRIMLGDIIPNGAIQSNAEFTETAEAIGPFILWSAGADGQWGPQGTMKASGNNPSATATPSGHTAANAAENKAAKAGCDDVIFVGQ